MAVLIEATDLKKRFGEIVAVDGISLEVQQRRGAGLSRPQRRRQVDDHEDAHGLPGARRRQRPHRRHRRARAPEAGESEARLPAGGRALLRRHDARAPSSPSSRRSAASIATRPSAASPPRSRRRELGLGAGAEDRDAVEGLQAARRHRPGDPARPAGADHGRADRRPRSQPEAPGAQADRRDGRGQGHHRLHPHPGGGGGGVLARHHHQPRPHRRRRHGRGPDAPAALSQRHRHAALRRAAPRRSPRRSPSSPPSPRSRRVGATNGRVQLRATAQRQRARPPPSWPPSSARG